MKVLSLSCNHCGAPLEVSRRVRFLTCTYCASRLEVKRSGNAAYTEVLESVDRRTEKIAEDVETIKVQNRLEQLDREWQMERARFLVRGKNGVERVPSSSGALVGGILAAAFGIFWTVQAVSMGAPVFFPAFGVIFVLAALIGTFKHLSRAGGYSERKHGYESRRRRLVEELHHRARRGDGASPDP